MLNSVSVSTTATDVNVSYITIQDAAPQFMFIHIFNNIPGMLRSLLFQVMSLLIRTKSWYRKINSSKQLCSQITEN